VGDGVGQTLVRRDELCCMVLNLVFLTAQQHFTVELLATSPQLLVPHVAAWEEKSGPLRAGYETSGPVCFPGAL
jgi:hypothetical protein